MTKTYGITLLSLATLFADPQHPQPANVYRLETKYDPVADTTTVKCKRKSLTQSIYLAFMSAMTD
jgi:hypothetical protein